MVACYSYSKCMRTESYWHLVANKNSHCYWFVITNHLILKTQVKQPCPQALMSHNEKVSLCSFMELLPCSVKTSINSSKQTTLALLSSWIRWQLCVKSCFFSSLFYTLLYELQSMHIYLVYNTCFTHQNTCLVSRRSSYWPYNDKVLSTDFLQTEESFQSYLGCWHCL